MADFKIVLGNKNYSSWSLRGWLALKHVGVRFDEIVVLLDQPDTKEKLAKVSPSGRVPAMIHGDLTVWDSLAICEYLNEAFPEAGLWPAARDARAVARSVSAEMHAGFQALRTHMPMNIRADKRDKGIAPAVREDIDRIRAVWRDCRSRFGQGGRFLFGGFCAADAMYAPVVSRFRTYGVPLEGEEAAYAQAVWDAPVMQEWVAAARSEPWVVPVYD